MATMAHDRTTRTSGLAFALLSASSFGLSGPIARGLLDAGWSAGAAVTARVVLAALVLTPAALVALRGRWFLVRRNAGLITAYGLVAVAGCQLAFFNAVARMPVGVALLIEYMSPVAVVAFLWARTGVRPGPRTLVGAGLALLGLLLVLDLLSGARADVVGVAWALAAMLGGATYFVLSARDADGLPPTVLAAGGLLLGGAALLLAGATGIVSMRAGTAPVPFAIGTLDWWVPVLVLGVVTAAVAYVAGIAATRRLGARLASFVALTEVLAALVFAWVLLGEVPRAIQLAGGALVLAGVIVVRSGEPAAVAPAE